MNNLNVIVNKHSSVLTQRPACPPFLKAYPVEQVCIERPIMSAGSLYNNSGQKTWGASSSELLRNRVTEACCSKTKQIARYDASDMTTLAKRRAAGAIPINRPRNSQGVSPAYQGTTDFSLWTQYTAGIPTRRDTAQAGASGNNIPIL